MSPVELDLAEGIRSLAPGDGPEVLRLRRALFPESTDLAGEMDPYLAGQLGDAHLLGHDRGDGRLGGFVLVGQRAYAEGCLTTPVGYLEEWYVDPDLRRSGVGAALVRGAESWCAALGFSEIASDCLIDNDVSAKAHLALGFDEVERIICFRKPITARPADAGDGT